MGEHQPAYRGMGLHHPVFCQADAYPFHVYQFVQQEAHRDVRKRRVAYGRTYALVFFVQQLPDGQLFVGGVFPDFLAHGFVYLLGSGLGQAFAQGLYQELLIVVVAVCRFHPFVDGRGESAHRVGDAR